jgi:hypothetical protein
MSEALRVGFVVDGLTVPAWQAELIESARRERGLQSTLFVIEPRASAPRHPVLAAYDAFDRFLDRGRGSLLRTVTVEPAGATVLTGTPGQGLDPDRIARWSEQGLDLLIDLGAHDLEPAAARAARYGLWMLQFGDDTRRGEELPQLWEITRSDSLAVASIVAMSPDGTRRVVGRTTCSTHPYSLIRTRSVVIAALMNLTLGRLRALRDLGPALPARWRAVAEPAGTRPPAPGALGLATRFAICALRVAGRIWSIAARDDFYWSVAVAPRPAGLRLEAAMREATFREMPQPPDWFHADPFVFEHRGRPYLFVEAFPYATGRGVIAVSRVEADGSVSRPEPVLERPYHLSYPYVFDWRGQTFMLPETSGNRTIELYRCEHFPDRWALDTVLMKDVEAADATVLEHAGRLWMFVTVASRGMSPDTELHLFHAEDLRGPWQAHPLNPIVSDVRRARPAGALWEEDGQLIRPSQDCTPGYAFAISFQRITTLTPEDYAEETFARLTASQLRWKRNARRTHHWFMGPRFMAIDATVSRFRRLPGLPRRAHAPSPAAAPSREAIAAETSDQASG